MYLGNMMESGSSEEVFSSPQHPYTKALLGSAPRPDPDYIIPQGLLQGEIGSAINPLSGCAFHPRCPVAMAQCTQTAPLISLNDCHQVSCHAITM